MGMERHFDKKQAAEFLGVSPYTIIAWKKQGVLGFTRLGRAIRYPESELVRLSRQGFQAAKNQSAPEQAARILGESAPVATARGDRVDVPLERIKEVTCN
jgi:excisionase family DNA binding protein